MLWYKGWLETRWKFLFILVFYAVFIILGANSPAPPAPAGSKVAPQVTGLAVSSTIAMIYACVMLAGAGIATQPSFRVTKGLHGSALFTLSLPVSRFRLLAIRASLGWLEMASLIGCVCGIWLFVPLMRALVTPFDLLRFMATLLGCGSAIYFASVLLGTLVEETWRVFGTMIAVGALWLILNKTPAPAAVNIFRAMVDDSPLIAHTMPWAQMALSIGLSAILFLAALKAARTREY
jgi:hypothetical protein